MDAQTVIDSYVNDVAARLPRSLRNDVGLELRSLLVDELNAAAQEAGRPADEQLALNVVQDFGQPEAVAAHYSAPGFMLVEPEQAPTFVMVAVSVVAAQWLFTLPPVFHSAMSLGDWARGPGLGALSWVGLLVAWFAMATWIRRRSPVDPRTQVRPWTHWIFWLPMTPRWRPVDRAAEARRMAPSLIVLGLVVTLFLMAPAWWVALATPAGTQTGWLLYDAGFRHWILVPLMALIIARILLLVFVTAQPRRWAPTEDLRGVLWFCFVALLVWVLFGWQIFANGLTNTLFKVWLSVFVLVNTIQLAAWLRRAVLKVRAPEAAVAGPYSRPG